MSKVEEPLETKTMY